MSAFGTLVGRLKALFRGFLFLGPQGLDISQGCQDFSSASSLRVAASEFRHSKRRRTVASAMASTSPGTGPSDRHKNSSRFEK